MSSRYRVQYTFDSEPHPRWGRDYMTTVNVVDSQTGNIVETTEGYSKKDPERATKDARVAAFAWIAERERQDVGQMTTTQGKTDGE